MGGCLGANPRRAQNGEKYNEQPTDTLLLNASNFSQLTFHALLTKLKLKRCNYYKHVGIKISLGKHQEFQLKPKFVVNDTARWDVYHEFQFKATEFELRKEFMLFTFVDDKSNVIGNLKINLYLLATGPYHQDFALDFPKAEGARISFNLKIAQQAKLKLQILEAELMPKDKQFPGDIFAFSLCSILGERVEQSDLSYQFLVAFNEKETENGVDNKNDSTNTTVTYKQSLKSGAKKIYWSTQKSNHMPFVQMTLPLFDLHGASFSIVFYYFNNKKIKHFSSQCFISYNKLANFQSSQRRDPQTKKIFNDRVIEIETKTWDHGQETGVAKFKIKFVLEKHLKQLQLCVRTQKGIFESSPVFGELSSGSKIPEELIELEKLGNQIQNQFVQVSTAGSSLKNDNWVRQVNKRLIMQKEILMKSNKESILIFAYPDQSSLLKGQRGLIELGKRIRALLNEDKEQIAPNCWELLITLIKRGELNLSNMGFSQEQIDQSHAGKGTEFIKRKIQVALSYYLLLVDLLEQTFRSLQAYNYDSQKQFAELFCAYSYFRLPKFRNQVLSVITRADDPQIEEWRGTQYSLKDIPLETAPQTQTSFSLMFDWENKFYKILQHDQGYGKTEAQLLQLFRTSSWEQRMKKRGGAFFAFVKFWAKYVETIAINSKHINWRYFPGYNKILLSFMAEMKIRSISEYTDIMKQAAASLLANEKLLNPFVLIVFRKTNQNDQPNVIKTFELISSFFLSIKNRGRGLPTTFDFKMLLKVMKSILEGEASYSIGKVLLLYYDHYKLYPIDFRLEMSNYLLTKVFFKLFLHWSQNVRTIFHHLLFIRIYHQASKPIEQIDAKDQQQYRSNPQNRTELVSRYRKLMLILENAQHFRHKIGGRKIDNYEKQTYKKMKKKIQERRKEIRSNVQVTDKPKITDQAQYRKQLMLELGQPKLQRYNSEVFSRNLKVVVEKKVQNKQKEEVIVKNGTNKKIQNQSSSAGRKRKVNFFELNFEEQLVPLKMQEIPYAANALQEYSKINEMFIKSIQKNKEALPVVKLELSLDQKQIRPNGLSENDQW